MFVGSYVDGTFTGQGCGTMIRKGCVVRTGRAAALVAIAGLAVPFVVLAGARPALAVAPAVERISVDSNGMRAEQSQAVGFARLSISSSGRYVAFYSYDLLTPDASGGPNVYVRDRATGTTELVSNGPTSGGEAPNNMLIGMSSDGRFVVFASNEVFEAGAASYNVYRRDRTLGTTELITPRNLVGTRSFPPSSSWFLSANGLYIAFSSPNFWWSPGLIGHQGVFVIDITSGVTEAVALPTNDNYHYPTVSDDGNRVAWFASGATVVDRSTGQTIYSHPGGASTIAPDGSRLAITVRDSNNVTQVAVADLATGTTTGLTAAVPGQFASVGGYDGSWSSDSRKIAFVANYPVSPDGASGVSQVFVQDLISGATHAAPSLLGATPDGNSQSPAVADSGAVAFISDVTGLVPDDESGVPDTYPVPWDPRSTTARQDVYVQDEPGAVDIVPPAVSIANVADGAVYALGAVPVAACVAIDPMPGSGIALEPVLTLTGGNPDGSGTFTATCSGAQDLAGNVSAPVSATFDVHYAGAPSYGIVSLSNAGLPGTSSSGVGGYRPVVASPDGSKAFFSSGSPDLTTTSPAPVGSQVYVRDRAAGLTELISRTASGSALNGSVLSFGVSRSGRFLAFVTAATNVGVGHDNGQFNLYLRDLVSGSVSWQGTSQYYAVADTGVVYQNVTAVTPDGRYAVVLDPSASVVNVVDTTTGVVTRASAAANGTPANGQSLANGAAISTDGRKVTFWSVASNLVSGYVSPCAPNNCGGVYQKDLVTGSVVLLTSDFANTDSQVGQILGASDDGSVVSFCALGSFRAGNDPSPTLSGARVYVHAVGTGATLDASIDGGQALNPHSFDCPSAISGDGATILVVGNTSFANCFPRPGLPCPPQPPLQVYAEQSPFVVGSDIMPPTVSGVPDRSPDSASWYSMAVTVSWTATDDVDGIMPAPPAVTVSTDGVGQVVTSDLVCDVAGNCASGSVTVNVDQAAPGLSVLASPVANAAGWNNSQVTLTPSCSDQTSGVASCPVPVTVSGEGGSQAVSFTATDVAGNSRSVSTSVSIDLTAPTLTLSAPAGGSSVPMAAYVPPSCIASDLLSGLDGVCSVSVVETGTVPGAIDYTATATASDLAGNSTTRSRSFTVITDVSAPVIESTPDRAANAAGWWAGPVTFSFACSDPSGVVACPAPRTVAGDGANQSFTVSASDYYGNVGSLVVSGVNIDSVAPTITVSAPAVVGPADVVSISCSASDGLSGIDSAVCADRVFPATELQVGENFFTYLATDVAGNTTARTVIITLQVSPASVGVLIEVYLGNTAGAGGILNSLVNKLNSGSISAFVAQIEAQCCTPAANKRFTRQQADTLIALANEI
jgi:hypothetical protein